MVNRLNNATVITILTLNLINIDKDKCQSRANNLERLERQVKGQTLRR